MTPHFMDQPRTVHHITYEFPTAGLTPAVRDYHTEDMRSALSEHFGIPREDVRVKTGPSLELDVHVMRGSGNSPDYDKKMVAMKVVMPHWQGLHYTPTLLLERAADSAAWSSSGAAREVVLRVLVPTRHAAGVLNG